MDLESPFLLLKSLLAVEYSSHPNRGRIKEELMNERRIGRIETFVSILNVIGVLAIIYAVVIIILWFINGGIWFGEIVLPLHGLFFFAGLVLTFLVLIPLMVIKTTRPYSGLGLYHLTYLFGGIAWFYSAYYCLYFIGIAWLIIGFLLAGVGVVPVAVIGSVIQGQWGVFGLLAVQLIAAVGCRALAGYAVTTSED